MKRLKKNSLKALSMLAVLLLCIAVFAACDSKKEPSIADISALDKVFDGQAIDFVPSLSEGDGELTVEWYRGDEKLSQAPTEAGEYKLVIIVAESENFKAARIEKTVVISQNANATISNIPELGKTYDGKAVALPTLTTTSDGSITFEWYRGSEKLTAAPIDAGEYKLVASVAATANFGAVKAEKSFTIAKATATISAIPNLDKTYNAIAVVAPTLTTNSDGNVVIEWYRGSEKLTDAPKNAGEYKLVAKVAATSNYTAAEAEKSLVIAKAEATLSDIPTLDRLFDETAMTAPALTTNSDGTIVFEWYKGSEKLEAAPVNPGEYKLVASVAATINYTEVSVEKAFTIIPKETAMIIGMPESLDKTYNKIAVSTPALTTNSDGAVVIEWYRGEEKLISAPVDAGEYKLVASVAATVEYSAARLEKSFTIAKETATVSGMPESLDKTYNNTAVATPSFTTNSNGAIVVEWYRGEEKLAMSPVNAGEYKLVVSVAETANYTAVKEEKSFTIAKATAAISGMPESLVRNYDGTPTATPESVTTNSDGTITFAWIKVWDEGWDRADETLNAAPVDVFYFGKYYLVASVAETDNYNAVSESVEATIILCPVSITMTVNDKVYDGTPIAIADISIDIEEITAEMLELYWYKFEGSKWTQIEGAPTDAGKYSLEWEIDVANYEYSVDSVEFTISKATTTITPAYIQNLNKPYDGTPVEILMSYTAANGADIIFEWYRGEEKLAAAPSDAGIYRALVRSAETENYLSASIEQSFTISKIAAYFDNVPEPGKVYDGEPVTSDLPDTNSDGTIAVKWMKGSVVLEGPPTEVGSYKVVYSVPATNNFNPVTTEKSFTIDKASVTITIPDDFGKVYDGEPIEPDGVFEDSDAEITLAWYVRNGANYDPILTAPINAGLYKLVASTAETPNCYAATAEKIFEIEKAAPEILFWMQDSYIENGDATIKYNGSKVSIHVDETNIPYFDINDAVILWIDTTTHAYLPDAPINAGSYAIDFEYSDPNGNFSDYYGGTEFVIAKAEPTITYTISDKVYDGSPIAFDSLATTSDDPTGVVVTWFGLGTAPVTPGTYHFTLSVAESNNYEACSVEGEATINKAQITLNWKDDNLVYDGNVKNMNPAELLGLVAGDAAPTYTTVGDAINATEAGFTITAEMNFVAGKADYYIMTDVVLEKHFTIQKKALTVVSINVGDKSYDRTTKAPIVEWGGVNGIVVSDVGSVEVVPHANFEQIQEGTDLDVLVNYELTGAKAGNYTAPSSQRFSDRAIKGRVLMKISNSFWVSGRGVGMDAVGQGIIHIGDRLVLSGESGLNTYVVASLYSTTLNKVVDCIVNEPCQILFATDGDGNVLTSADKADFEDNSYLVSENTKTGQEAFESSVQMLVHLTLIYAETSGDGSGRNTPIFKTYRPYLNSNSTNQITFEQLYDESTMGVLEYLVPGASCYATLSDTDFLFPFEAGESFTLYESGKKMVIGEVIKVYNEQGVDAEVAIAGLANGFQYDDPKDNIDISRLFMETATDVGIKNLKVTTGGESEQITVYFIFDTTKAEISLRKKADYQSVTLYSIPESYGKTGVMFTTWTDAGGEYYLVLLASTSENGFDQSFTFSMACENAE